MPNTPRVSPSYYFVEEVKCLDEAVACFEEKRNCFKSINHPRICAHAECKTMVYAQPMAFDHPCAAQPCKSVFCDKHAAVGHCCPDCTDLFMTGATYKAFPCVECGALKTPYACTTCSQPLCLPCVKHKASKGTLFSCKACAKP